jgi:hypothetical protein
MEVITSLCLHHFLRVFIAHVDTAWKTQRFYSRTLAECLRRQVPCVALSSFLAQQDFSGYFPCSAALNVILRIFPISTLCRQFFSIFITIVGPG